MAKLILDQDMKNDNLITDQLSQQETIIHHFYCNLGLMQCNHID